MTALLFGATGCAGPGLQASVLLPLPWFATLYGEAFAITRPTEDPHGCRHLRRRRANDPRQPHLHRRARAVLRAHASRRRCCWVPTSPPGRAVDCVAPAPCDPALADAPRSNLYGADLYFKWKPPNVAQTYGSVQWTTEYFARTLAEGGPTEGAGYTRARRPDRAALLLGGRFDMTGLPAGPTCRAVTATPGRSPSRPASSRACGSTRRS